MTGQDISYLESLFDLFYLFVGLPKQFLDERLTSKQEDLVLSRENE